LPLSTGQNRAPQFDEQNVVEKPEAQTAGLAIPAAGIAIVSEPARRLASLRALSGSSKYAKNDWRFTGFNELVLAERANGSKRCSEKTIRVDLKDAAQAERDAKSSRPFDVINRW
jgi:hypothetical protein